MFKVQCFGGFFRGGGGGVNLWPSRWNFNSKSNFTHFSGSPNLDQRCKITWLRSLLFWSAILRPLQSWLFHSLNPLYVYWSRQLEAIHNLMSLLSIVPLHWGSVGCWNTSSWKTGTFLFYTINTMGADVLEMLGARILKTWGVDFEYSEDGADMEYYDCSISTVKGWIM